MDAKIQHLQMIQGVINRLASNSFKLKGWSVLLVSACFALAAKDASPWFVYLAYLPACAFWGLDGYFLRQERLFRALYDHVRKLPDDTAVDFSMNTTPHAGGVEEWWGVTTSKTLLPFHGPVLLAVIATTILKHIFG